MTKFKNHTPNTALFFQKKVMNGIESLCDHLPGPATTAKLCKEEVEKMLPVVINFITAAVVGWIHPLH